MVYITPPADPNSETMSEEIYALHHLATAAQLAAANDDNEHEDIFAIGRVLSSKFNKEQLPVTAVFWTAVNNDLSIFDGCETTLSGASPLDFDPGG